MVATKISDSIKSIEGVKFIEREFVNSDLEGCSFCIAATDDKNLMHMLLVYAENIIF